MKFIKNTITAHSLEVSVFASGAIGMVLELVGSRILAPYVGTSIFVWTSLIGIVLASLSIGYSLGGKLADSRPTYKMLSAIVFIAGISIFITTITKSFVLVAVDAAIQDVRLGAVIASVLLFTLPSLFLGMISPYAVRLRIKNLKNSGATIGNLYAIGTFGSIFGTFLSGFFLIAYFTNTAILYSLCLILCLLSMFLSPNNRFWLTAKVGFLLLVTFIVYRNTLIDTSTSNGGFIDVDTAYSKVWIFDRQEDTTLRPIRLMKINREVHSGIYLDGDELLFDYTKHYWLSLHFHPSLDKALLLGGAGYTFPRDFIRKLPRATIDVVEIDPELTRLAKLYFKLSDSPRLRIFHEDARTYINRTKERYDVVFGDAYNSSYSVPFQLTTREAMQKIHSILQDDGLFVMNIISSLDNITGKLLWAEYATLRTVFPQVYILPVDTRTDKKLVQNILLFAMKSEKKPTFISKDEEHSIYLRKVLTSNFRSVMPILTDELAPVDQYAIFDQ